MPVSAKTLRALAKEVGHNPAQIFKLRPDELEKLLTENYADLSTWDDVKAEAEIQNLKGGTKAEPVVEEPALVVEEKPVVAKKEPKAPKLKKVNVEDIHSEIESVLQTPSSLDTLVHFPKEEERHLPTKKRLKKKVPMFIAADSSNKSADLEELKERIINLEMDNKVLLQKLNDISSFLAWFCNSKIDPTEPIKSLDDVDWDACIDIQLSE